LEVEVIEEKRVLTGTTDVGTWTLTHAALEAAKRTKTGRDESRSVEIGPIDCLLDKGITIEMSSYDDGLPTGLPPPRPKWKLDDLTRPRESLADVLMQAVVGRHIGEGRAPRSNRRVVRAGASSRDGPSSDDDPPSDRVALLGRGA
jgi:hypothetical protein